MTSILRLFAGVVVIVLVGVLAVNHRASGIEGALIGIGVIAVLVGGEFALIFRLRQRRDMKMTRGLGPGEFFAGRVSMFPFEGRRGLPASGTIVFSDVGAKFSPKRDGSQSVDLPWTGVEQISLRPQPGKIGVGLLVLRLPGGDARTFSVAGYGAMAKALSERS